jgi:hypothetical protein
VIETWLAERVYLVAKTTNRLHNEAVYSLPFVSLYDHNFLDSACYRESLELIDSSGLDIIVGSNSTCSLAAMGDSIEMVA